MAILKYRDITIDGNVNNVNIIQGEGCNIQDKTFSLINENKTYTFNPKDEGLDGYGRIEIQVDVPQGGEGVSIVEGTKFAESRFTEIPQAYYDYINTMDDWGSMFVNSSIESFDPEKLNPTNVVTITTMFNNTKISGKYDLTHWNMSNVRDISMIIRICGYIQELNVSGWDLRNCNNFYEAFAQNRREIWNDDGSMRYEGLKKLDMSNWKLSSEWTVALEGPFFGCAALVEANCSGIDWSRVHSMGWNFFNECYALRKFKTQNFCAHKDIVDVYMGDSPIAVNSNDVQDAYEYSIETFRTLHDRRSEDGWEDCLLVLHPDTANALGQELIEEIKTKGYIVNVNGEPI